MGRIRWRKTQSKRDRGHREQSWAGSQGGQAQADACISQQGMAVSLSEHSQSQPSLRGKYKYGGNAREQGGRVVDLDEL